MSTKENDPLLSHEYDGIREYDNPTPAWWNWTFIATVVFSVGYVAYYHFGSGRSVAEAYALDLQRAAEVRSAQERAANRGVNEASLAALMADSAAVAEGKARYDMVCAACHGMKGEGLIGPNLTDAHWIHGGGSLMGIRKIVANGVVEKGMVAWKDQMAPALLNKVVAYVGTFRGQNVPGKAPQGVKVGTE